jgi:O-antigen/teichoic acid export membrane protein
MFHPSIRYLNSTILAGLLIQLSNFVGGVILARSLGASGRGFVAAAMLWPPLLASLAGLGVTEALLFRAARSEVAAAKGLSGALLVGAGQSLFVAACGWLVLPRVLGQMPAEIVTISRYYLVFIPLTYITGFLVSVLQVRGYRFNLVRASVHIAYTAVLLVLWLGHLIDPLTVIAASLGANAVTLLLGMVLVHRQGWWRPRFDPAEARALLGFGYRVHIGSIATFLAARLDLVVLAALVSASELGNYAIAGIPGSVLTLLPASASMVAYPAVARMQTEAVPATVARCLVVFVVMIFLAFLVDLMLPIAIPRIFGPSYQQAVAIGQILTFGIAIRSTTGLLAAVVRGLSRPLSAGLGDIIGLPIFGTLLILMVPIWQGIGAAIAVSAAGSVGFAVMLVLSMRAAGMRAVDLGPLWRIDAVRIGSVIRRASTCSAAT